MTKRKPQITITEAERLALIYALGLLINNGSIKGFDDIIQNLLDRSKRKEDF